MVICNGTNEALKGFSNPICYTLTGLSERVEGVEIQPVDFYDEAGIRTSTRLPEEMVESLGGFPFLEDETEYSAVDANACYEYALSLGWSGTLKGDTRFVSDSIALAGFCAKHTGETAPFKDFEISTLWYIHTRSSSQEYLSALEEVKRRALRNIALEGEEEAAILSGTGELPTDLVPSYNLNYLDALISRAEGAIAENNAPMSILFLSAALQFAQKEDMLPNLVAYLETIRSISQRASESLTVGSPNIAREFSSYVEGWIRAAESLIEPQREYPTNIVTGSL